MTPGRMDRMAPLAAAVLATAAVVLAIEPWPVGVFQDDGIYVVLARALATGEGFRFTQMPGAPHATHYPPGYPLFLAALWKLAPSFPSNVTLFKFANAALVGLVAILTWWFARRQAQLGAVGAGATAVLFTACSPVVLLSVMVMSEPLFMVGVLLALAAGERAARSGTTRDAVVAGIAGVALAMVRTLGILVVPATVVALAWRRHWRAALVTTATAVIGLLPWQLWVAAHAGEVPAIFTGKYGSYSGWLGDAVRSGGLAWVAEVVRFNAGRL
ncbi:MAG: glycosyltransferase family 39 protein, partial [Gemmatimonadetes bacterium]|nr:glycosyltransferase family 39 protein [Gemmatimonadota bacterium]